MERRTRPKRYARQLGLMALGQAVDVEPDGALSDALFLAAHPGWTWADLQDAPDDIVALLRSIARAQAGVKTG